MIERTLVLIKPDGVMRGLIGEIIKRFEQRGLKVVALKMKQADKDFAQKHYTEDLAIRRGAHIRELSINYIITGPVVAMVIEGVDAIDNVRNTVGSTEPKSALPGTIRGDFSHVSYSHADERKKAIANLIHASSDAKDAKAEIDLWFSSDEIYSYDINNHKHVF